MTDKIDPIVSQLKQMRIDQKLKQYEAADMLGIGHSMMSSYENGAVCPRIDQVRSWADVFGMELTLASNGAAPVVSRERDRASAGPSTVSVKLTQYQAALAMGMLIASSQNGTGQMAADLKEIADTLAHALSR